MFRGRSTGDLGWTSQAAQAKILIQCRDVNSPVEGS